MAEAPLARVGQTENIRIIWRPFELRPAGAPPPPAEYIERAWTQSVGPMAERLGVEMKRPAVFPHTTRPAHEAALFARRFDKEAEMADAIFRAYWQDGRDIGQIDVLCDVALSVGIDPVLVREALESRTMNPDVEAELAQARRYGIDAVPFFIVGGKFATRGLQTEESLRSLIGRVTGQGLIQLD